MASLGLVERKRGPILPKVVNQPDRPVNSYDETSVDSPVDEILTNPDITMLDIYKEFKKYYLLLQNKYKYILKEKKRRLEIGFELNRKLNSIYTKTGFYETVTLPDESKKKKFYAIIEQRIYPFVELFNVGEDGDQSSIKLRTTNNEGFIEELTSLANVQGVEITLIGACAGAVNISDIADPSEDNSLENVLEQSLLSQRAKKEEEEEKLRQEAILKARAEAELADCSPLPHVEPISYEDQLLNNDGCSILFGNLDEDDLSKPIDTVFDESFSNPSEVLQEEDEKFEIDPKMVRSKMNDMGKEIYQTHDIHKKVIMAIDCATKYFPLYITTSENGNLSDSSVKTKIEQSLLFAGDVQSTYENDYAKIAPLKQMLVKLFPLSRLIPNGKNTSQLWIRNLSTGDLLPLSKPDKFSICFVFSEKEYGTIFHKVCVIADESKATKKSLELGEENFVKDFLNQSKDLEKKQIYAGAAIESKSQPQPVQIIKPQQPVKNIKKIQVDPNLISSSNRKLF
jgi:hypothetical protein